MAGKGGYQAPREPAPVSGPGALSQRTDGGPAQAMRDLPNAKYGENAEFRSVQSGAPMAAAPSLNGTGGGAATPPAPGASPLSPPMPLTGGTQNPDQPVTAGSPLGPGANTMQLPMGAGYTTVAQRLQSLAATSGNPDIQFLAGLAGEGRF